MRKKEKRLPEGLLNAKKDKIVMNVAWTVYVDSLVSTALGHIHQDWISNAAWDGTVIVGGVSKVTQVSITPF